MCLHGEEHWKALTRYTSDCGILCKMENIHIFCCCKFELASDSRTGTCVWNLQQVDKETLIKSKIPHLPVCVCVCVWERERERERERWGWVIYFLPDFLWHEHFPFLYLWVCKLVAWPRPGYELATWKTEINLTHIFHATSICRNPPINEFTGERNSSTDPQ